MSPEFAEQLETYSESKSIDFYKFNGNINTANADLFVKLIRDHPNKRQNCALILTTNGGDPDAGYRVARIIKKYYKRFILYVLGYCKSTGTLIALGSDEIIMGDYSEFGPLDIQLTQDDELRTTSGLSYAQSLYSLSEQLFQSFEENFINLKAKSDYTITTKTAAEIGSKLAIGLISPISAQLDPIKLGEVQRAIRIAEAYGKRLCRNSDLVRKLIASYPSHSFVIDFKEAKDIFSNVRNLEDSDIFLEQELLPSVRYENEDIEDIGQKCKEMTEVSKEKTNIEAQN